MALRVDAVVVTALRVFDKEVPSSALPDVDGGSGSGRGSASTARAAEVDTSTRAVHSTPTVVCPLDSDDFTLLPTSRRQLSESSLRPRPRLSSTPTYTATMQVAAAAALVLQRVDGEWAPRGFPDVFPPRVFRDPGAGGAGRAAPSESLPRLSSIRSVVLGRLGDAARLCLRLGAASGMRFRVPKGDPAAHDLALRGVGVNVSLVWPDVPSASEFVTVEVTDVVGDACSAVSLRHVVVSSGGEGDSACPADAAGCDSDVDWHSEHDSAQAAGSPSNAETASEWAPHSDSGAPTVFELEVEAAFTVKLRVADSSISSESRFGENGSAFGTTAGDDVSVDDGCASVDAYLALK